VVKSFNLIASVPGYISTLQLLTISLKKKVFIGMPINKIITTFIFLAGLFFLSCNPSEPEKAPAGLEFKAEDASCTEAWIKLKVNDIVGAEVYRGDALIFNFAGQNIDTTLYDEGLLPNHVYKYHTSIQLYSNSNAVTKELTLQTMDTTSHNFTWQTFTFGGEAGSSVLNDVAIIDENNIWAVGEIYMKDSLGNPDPHTYNAVHWDGSEWKVKKITVLFRGSIITPPLEGVFAFAEDDIWFVGSLPIHGDGINWTMFDLRTTVDPNLSLSRAWGSNTNNIYFVGRKGNIAHWDGVKWSKIESEIDVKLRDIWGTPNGKTVWVSGYEDFKPTILLKISNSIIETVFNSRDYLFVNSPDHISGGIVSVWTNNT